MLEIALRTLTLLWDELLETVTSASLMEAVRLVNGLFGFSKLTARQMSFFALIRDLAGISSTDMHVSGDSPGYIYFECASAIIAIV